MGSAADIGSDFTVLVDDLRLTRPLVFADLPETSHAVKKPILVVGKMPGGIRRGAARAHWRPA